MGTTHDYDKLTSYEPMLTFTSANSYAPNYNIIDLDYPLYGTTVVKCDGRRFDLEVVRKALVLAAELGGELKDA